MYARTCKPVANIPVGIDLIILRENEHTARVWLPDGSRRTLLTDEYHRGTHQFVTAKGIPVVANIWEHDPRYLIYQTENGWRNIPLTNLL